jgi:formate dehydrogenase major subunit
MLDGPLPTHYEPQDSPVVNPLYPEQQRNPTRALIKDSLNPLHPDPDQPGTAVFPYVLTTYRLTEHFTGGGMSRTLPYLAELQPHLFVEVSPELAAERGLEHNGWATIVTARSAIEARVLVTERMTPLEVAGRVIHQIGLPYHFGPNGLARSDAPNELTSASMDPNVHIQETKVLTADIQPGHRPRGPALPEYVEEYRRRADVTDETGRAVRS